MPCNPQSSSRASRCCHRTDGGHRGATVSTQLASATISLLGMHCMHVPDSGPGCCASNWERRRRACAEAPAPIGVGAVAVVGGVAAAAVAAAAAAPAAVPAAIPVATPPAAPPMVMPPVIRQQGAAVPCAAGAVSRVCAARQTDSFEAHHGNRRPNHPAWCGCSRAVGAVWHLHRMAPLPDHAC